MTMKDIDEVAAARALAFGIGIVIILFSWPSVPVFQIHNWLRDGYWTPLELRLAWQWLGGPEPSFTWVGVQNIAVAILDTPLSVAIMVATLPVPVFLEDITLPVMTFLDRCDNIFLDKRNEIAVRNVVVAIASSSQS